MPMLANTRGDKIAANSISNTVLFVQREEEGLRQHIQTSKM